jgi:hypothetical protein
LTSIAQKSANIKKEWTSECTEAMNHLKKLLTEAPILVAPDPTKSFTLTTDASDGYIGALLEQEGRPVAYLSQKLKPAET